MWAFLLKPDAKRAPLDAFSSKESFFYEKNSNFVRIMHRRILRRAKEDEEYEIYFAT